MSVHFMFTGDNKDLLRKAQESRKEILAIDKQAKETSQSMETSFGSMGAAIAAFFTAQQASAIINKIIEVRGEFQKFKAVLSNTLGSDQKAQSAMDMLTDFASKTPFQVNELTASFVKLANQGFTPAYDEMMKLGDLASSTGKGFDQLAEAIIDAQTGEMERLKEFGIRASKDGDKVTFTFKEQQTTVDNSAKAIREYILSLGAMEGVTGANAKIAATLTGQVSNLEDSITSMYNKIGQQHEGILSDAVGGAATLVENYEEVGAALAALIVSFGAYKAVTMGLVAMERSQANIKYTQEAAELAKLLPIKEAAINADISAAVAKGALTTAQAEGIMSLRAESAANLQSLQAVAAKAAAEKMAAKEVYKTSLERALASKQMVAQRQQELAAIMTTGNAEQIAAAKKALATAEEERHIAVKGRKIAADNLSVVSTNAESTAKAVNDVTTKSGTLSDIQATKAKELLAIATRGLAAAFNMIKGPLIIAAIAGIAYAVYKLITADTAAEKAQKKLNEEREKAIQLKQQMTSEADGLIAKINDETETIYAQIKAYDELIKRFPELKSLSFEEFKAMPQDKQKKMIGGILDEQELKNAEKAYEESLKRVKEIKRQIANEGVGSLSISGNSTDASIENSTKSTKDLNGQLEAALILLKGHEEELEKIKELQWQANTPIEEQIKHYEAIQTKLKEEFDALNKLQNPNKDLQSYAESMAGSWLDTKGIIENITLDSLNRQIEDTRDKLKGLRGEEDSKVQNKSYWEKKKKEAENALDDIDSKTREVLDKGDSKVSFKSLIDSGKTEEDAKKALESYADAKKKMAEADKNLKIYDTTGKVDKDAVSRLKAQQELSRAILESELKLQAGRISAMEEGKAKRLRLAKQEYDEALKQINDNEKEQLSKPEVTKSQKIQISDNASSLRLVEQEKLLKANTDIEKDYAKQIESIQSEVDSRFRTQLENRLVEIENYYKTQLKIAKEAGEVEEGEFIQMLLKKKTAETEYAKKENALSNLEFNEKTEVGQLENRSSGVYFVEEAEREKTEILRKYALERIALLESMGDEQSLKDAQLLQNTIDGYDKALSKPKTKSVNKMVDEKAIIALQKHFVKLGDAEDVAKEKAEKFAEGFKGKMQMVSDVAGILKESFGGISDELDMALDAVGNIAQGFAEGGLVGGISAAAGQVLSMVGNLLTAKKEIDKSMVEGYENYMDAINDLIDTQVALLDKLGGMAFGQNVINTTKDIAKSIAASRTLLTEAMSAGSGMFSHSDGYKANKMLAGYKSELREIGIYTTDLNRMSNEQLASLKKLPEVYARLPEDLRKYIDAIAEGIDKTEEFKQQVQDTILGLDFTSMADMIVDSLTDPSIDNALGDFEKNIDKTLASIIKNMLRRNILLTPLEKMMSDLYKSMETGKKDANGNPVYELTSGAAKSFKDNVLGLGKQFQDAWKVLEESFGSEGIDLMPKEEYKEKEDNTLKGAYAKASQESIDLLAGQTGAQRVAVESIREQMQFIRDLQVKGWKDVSDIKDLAGKIDKNSEQVAENTRQIKEVADKVADNTKKTAEVLDGGTINVNIKGM